MMRQARHILAVTLVATAICADRVANALPTDPQMTQIAGRLMEHLTVRFRRVVPAAQLYQPSRAAFGVSLLTRLYAPIDPLSIAPRQISPFQFRLPPPLA